MPMVLELDVQQLHVGVMFRCPHMFSHTDTDGRGDEVADGRREKQVERRSRGDRWE